ncbi:hypothetical protein ACFY3U_24345 [Micromonospora sp. NPDC000089]|uniref:hypothetical protein n=1 Tax=unclassified Micromonospora TaxID=2617518 RepID=UPI0036CD9251
MKHDFTRWLPAIAKNRRAALSTTEGRRAALSAAKGRVLDITRDRRAALGVAALGGLAFGPAAVAAPVTSGPHAGAVAAIELATGKARQGTTVESAQTTGGRTGVLTADKPSRDKLIPHGVEGAQSRVPLDDEQRANAKAIIAEAKRTGVGERGAVIGIATSLQESKLYNLGHLGAYNDHDSQGLFQQRPSSGWGTPEEITDPKYASRAFFDALKNVHGWQDLPLTTAAQTVQYSAYPYAYAQWEEQAADIVQQLW